ncbi:Aspartate aminotransferase [Ceratocystis lukuohia]|uniref:Aspartate aminotransferase n=1 Tax=Ceratocystis lukuohia TaxID=2019550 RepID=A0ABR4MGW4_9PEZI
MAQAPRDSAAAAAISVSTPASASAAAFPSSSPSFCTPSVPPSASTATSASLSCPNSFLSASSSTLSTAAQRLESISSHMASSVSSSAPASDASIFSAELVPQAPEDALFGLMRSYRADTNPKKVDLAEAILAADPELNHEYAPILGVPAFTSKAAELIIGASSPALAEKRVSSVQTISGTGAVHMGALFLSKFYRGNRQVYISNPTWANHTQIFNNVGLPVLQYPYFDKATRGLDFDGLMKSLSEAPDRSIVLLHPCAHNPTGVDPSQDQWKQISELLKKKNHFPFFDCAYQGFASGDVARDAWAISYFIEQGFDMLIAQSFAKNFGLYGERAGCLHAVASAASLAAGVNVATRVASQLAILQRSEISNPPLYGARIVAVVLNNEALYEEWKDNLRTMSGRIIAMRTALRSKLEELKTPGTWNHITDQIGMFSFTGLSPAQVLRIREESHIYMTNNGRISMAGLNTRNVEYVAQAIDKVVREVS